MQNFSHVLQDLQVQGECFKLVIEWRR